MTSAYPIPPAELVDRVRALTAELGEWPSRRRVMRECRVGAPRADAALASLRDEGFDPAPRRAPPRRAAAPAAVSATASSGARRPPEAAPRWPLGSSGPAARSPSSPSPRTTPGNRPHRPGSHPAVSVPCRPPLGRVADTDQRPRSQHPGAGPLPFPPDPGLPPWYRHAAAFTPPPLEGTRPAVPLACPPGCRKPARRRGTQVGGTASANGSTQAFGHLLRSRREELGRTQDELVKFGGPVGKTVRRLEHGDWRDLPSTLRKMDACLDWPEGTAEQLYRGHRRFTLAPPPVPRSSRSPAQSDLIQALGTIECLARSLPPSDAATAILAIARAFA